MSATVFSDAVIPPRLVIVSASPARRLWPSVHRNRIGRLGLMVRYAPTNVYGDTPTYAYTGYELPRVWREWTSREPQSARRPRTARTTGRMRSLADAVLVRLPERWVARQWMPR